MLQRIGFVCALALVLSFLGSRSVAVTEPKHPSPTTLHLVRTLKIVPGKQLEFLKWLKELGAAKDDRFYAHVEGADWDWVTVTPLPNPERYSRFSDSELTIQYRAFVAFHEDTFAHGPFTLDELLGAYERKQPRP